MATWVIARLTFREAIRRRIVLAALVLGAAFLVLYSLGFYFIQREIRADANLPTLARGEIHNFLLMAGMYAVNFLTIAMAALMSADTLAGEIGSGTVQALATKPVRRAAIVAGKWLGFAGLLALYVLLMAGGAMASVWIQSGYLAPNLVTGLALIYLASLLVMSVTLACSSSLSALATGGVVFGLFGLAFIGGWIEQFGAFLRNETAVNIGIVSSLIFPSEALWKRAAFEMTSPLVRALGGFSPFSSSSVPSPLMIAYAGLYLVAALAVAARQFSRRDL